MSRRRHRHGHGHGHGPPWRRRRAGPGAYLRWRLRRRIFLWFGVSILLTGIVSSAILWVVASPAGWWRDQVHDIQTFAAHRFEAVWDDAPARDALARDMATDLGVDVVVRDEAGGVLHRYGDACDDGYAVEVPDRGEVQVCLGASHVAPRGGWVWLVVAGIVLWAASGAIALRLTRPLMQLVDVTRQIGEGKPLDQLRMPKLGSSEFRIIGDAVREMATRIDRQLSDQRELLAAVSHELRTPLGHLRVLVDLGRQRGADPNQNETWLDEVEKEILAIDAMVDQLLASSRVDFGTLQRRELDAVALGLRALERANLDPTVLDASAERIELTGDAALLQQALANLLRNATEHGGGVTGVEVSASDDEVTFAVLDEGPGFGDAKAHAFDAFAPGPARKARAGSLGLGLALVQRIAVAHGGRAFAEDRPHAGARAGLTIPVGTEADA